MGQNCFPNQNQEHFQLIVIGNDPSGLSCLEHALQLGVNVCWIDNVIPANEFASKRISPYVKHLQTKFFHHIALMG